MAEYRQRSQAMFQPEKTGQNVRKNAAAFAAGLMIAVCSAGPALRSAYGTVEPLPAEKINPNTAAVPSLMRLPGIGRARATDIVEGRSTQPFGVFADLERIRGIGPKTVEKCEPYLTFEIKTQNLVDENR